MPAWEEFSPSWGYYKTTVLNIAGFVPLGFFFRAYLSGGRRHNSRATVETILTGAAISLTIELLQAYVPTRQSGMTDLVTNTLGTCIGAMLYQSKIVQASRAKLGLLSGHDPQSHNHVAFRPQPPSHQSP